MSSKRQDELRRQGWEERFVACEPRLSEWVENYTEMGFEVHLEPLPVDYAAGECCECFKQDRDKYRIICTRRPGTTQDGAPGGR
jgi:hypothetical protein